MPAAWWPGTLDFSAIAAINLNDTLPVQVARRPVVSLPVDVCSSAVLRSPPRLARALLVTGFFTLLACVNSFPLVLALDSTIGEHGDSYFSVWRLAWVAHQIRADPEPAVRREHLLSGIRPRSPIPTRCSLRRWPSRRFTGWASAPCSSTTSRCWRRSWPAAWRPTHWCATSPGARPPRCWEDVVFAFAPYRMEHFDHLELQFAFWIPLAALAWHRAADRDRLTDYLKVGALTAAQILSSIYYGIFLVTWLGVMTVLWHVRAPRRAARALVFSLALPLAVMAIYSVPYQKSHDAVGDRPRSEVAEYSARPLDFLSAPANNWLYGGTARWGANERHLFPGAVALALAVVGLWGTSDPRLRIHGCGARLFAGARAGLQCRALHAALRLGAALSGAARAGARRHSRPAGHCGSGGRRAGACPEPCAVARPSRAWLPRRGHRRVRGGVPHVAGAGRRRSAADGLVCVAARNARRRGLRVAGDRAVAPGPRCTTCTTCIGRQQHWRPLLNGYSGNYPRSYLELLNEMRSFPRASALRYLRRRGATVLVVHERREASRPYDEVLTRLHARSECRSRRREPRCRLARGLLSAPEHAAPAV